MNFQNPYWENITKIEMLQRWILVHSYLYYDLNSSVVSDTMFDKNCVQLATLKRKAARSYRRSKYGYAMKDFDGSTGFGFVELLNSEHAKLIMRDASNLKDGIIK